MDGTDVHHIEQDNESGEYKVTVYLRKLIKRNVYYARYKVDKRSLASNQRHITESLKTDKLDIALERARQKYAELKLKQKMDVGLKSMSVNETIDDFLRQYEEKLKLKVRDHSVHMLRAYRKTIDLYWREYIGEKDINLVTIDDLQGYEVWRKNWSKYVRKKKSYKSKYNSYPYKDTISIRTIDWELGSMKTLLRWASDKRIYNGTAFTWRFKSGKPNRRSAFTRDQYRSLHTYMRTNEYLSIGKHKNDSRIIRHRHMLRAYILFMANTGLRVGEARHLTWGDIEETKNKLGTKVVVVSVLGTHSKVNKTRRSVGRYTALRALLRWRNHLDDIGEKHTKKSFIFCNPEGKVIQDFRAGFNSVIKEADVEFGKEGDKLTIYSLRHSYITFRLMFGKNLSIHSLAKNTGTSVSMIEQFYDDAIPEDFIDELSI